MKEKRGRNIYAPKQEKPYKLSRSKIEDYTKCPRCFYLDRRLGINKPSQIPFNLNSAVDGLLKKEFDTYRAKKEPHPLMLKHKVDAIPFAHPELDRWRANFTGVQYHHQPTNFLLQGAIDDLWITPQNKLIIVDYKATSKDAEINLDSQWQLGYKRQMEIYQWLFRRNNFEVEDTGYFVYCNGLRTREAFNGRLEFDIYLLPYTASDTWVEATIHELHQCLESNEIPKAADSCELCAYVHNVQQV